MLHTKKLFSKRYVKRLTVCLFSMGLLTFATKAFSQSAPPPPPPPAEVLNAINPFKKNKNKKAKVEKSDNATVSPADAGGPPPPPNPLNLFKKKKKGSSSILPPPPPKPPGLE